MKTFHGSCHCGAVTFAVEAEVSRLVRCNCSICAKKGTLNLRVPPGGFTLITGEDDLALYQFNKKIAKHYFCRHCGIHAFFHPRMAPDRYVVNANCLDDFDVDTTDHDVSLFDGRNWEEAFAAQQRT